LNSYLRQQRDLDENVYPSGIGATVSNDAIEALWSYIIKSSAFQKAIEHATEKGIHKELKPIIKTIEKLKKLKVG